MASLNCDIIYDLLPSYIDGICTNATRQCVEEHLAGCPRCAENVRRMRETALSGESLEKIAFDALKKVRMRAVRQAVLRLLLSLPFLTFISLGLNLALRGRNVIFTGQILPWHGIGLLAVCLLECALFLRDQEQKMRGAERCALALSLTVMAASVGLMIYIYSAFFSSAYTADGTVSPLLGPAAHWLYALLFFIQLSIFLWELYRLWKRCAYAVPVLQAALTGMMLLMYYLMMMCSMSLDLDGGIEVLLRVQLRETGAALSLGVAGALLGIFLNKRRVRKNRGLPFEKNLL